jgi:hypothetical protein
MKVNYDNKIGNEDEIILICISDMKIKLFITKNQIEFKLKIVPYCLIKTCKYNEKTLLKFFFIKSKDQVKYNEMDLVKCKM